MEAFEHLKRLCSLRAWSSFSPQPDPFTPRVHFLIDTLKQHGIEARTDVFAATGRSPGRYVNVLVRFTGQTDPQRTIVVSAHHDVANADSENCQDNTASVAHLLSLCLRFGTRRPERHSLLIAFLDAEEIVDPERSGAGELSRQVLSGEHGDCRGVLNLELTANGKNLWCENGGRGASALTRHLTTQLPALHKTSTPYNDATAFRRFGLDAACLGSLDEPNFDELRRTGFCRTWALCHHLEDTFARSARSEDMRAFTDTVERVLRAPL